MAIYVGAVWPHRHHSNQYSGKLKRTTNIHWFHCENLAVFKTNSPMVSRHLCQGSFWRRTLFHAAVHRVPGVLFSELFVGATNLIGLTRLRAMPLVNMEATHAFIILTPPPFIEHLPTSLSCTDPRVHNLQTQFQLALRHLQVSLWLQSCHHHPGKITSSVASVKREGCGQVPWRHHPLLTHLQPASL
jgi:hypothetical protein